LKGIPTQSDQNTRATSELLPSSLQRGIRTEHQKRPQHQSDSRSAHTRQTPGGLVVLELGEAQINLVRNSSFHKASTGTPGRPGSARLQLGVLPVWLDSVLEVPPACTGSLSVLPLNAHRVSPSQLIRPIILLLILPSFLPVYCAWNTVQCIKYLRQLVGDANLPGLTATPIGQRPRPCKHGGGIQTKDVGAANGCRVRGRSLSAARHRISCLFLPGGQ